LYKFFRTVIEISVKGENVNPFEMIELSMIQAIRESNGECDEVRKSRENDLNILNKKSPTN
jgi:hypothetical protein